MQWFAQKVLWISLVRPKSALPVTLRSGLRVISVNSQSRVCKPLGHLTIYKRRHVLLFDLLEKHFVLEILSRLHHILRPPEVAPIIFIGAKAKDFFSLSSEA